MISNAMISQDNVTDAWISYVESVFGERPRREAFHAVVRVIHPTLESLAGREAIEAFLSEWRQKDKHVYPISTVRTTIFPKNYARMAKDASDLARLYRADYDRLRRSNPANTYGTYFGRLVDTQVSLDGTHYDQLNDTIRKLKANENATWTEIDLRYEFDDATPALSVYETERNHRRKMGFPCMSHLSFQRDGDTLHVAAYYRNQDVGRKAYGNMLGLGQLAEYIAQQSDLQLGVLTLMAGRAYLNAPVALVSKHLPIIKSAARAQ